MTGEVFYGERPHSLLMQPGAEGMPQDVGAVLILVDASQPQVSSHYTINIAAIQIKARDFNDDYVQSYEGYEGYDGEYSHYNGLYITDTGIFEVTVPPPIKADILEDSGVPGKGLEEAPGLQKPFNPKSLNLKLLSTLARNNNVREWGDKAPPK